VVIGVNTITGNQYLIPTQREKVYTLTVVIGAVVNFVLNLFLIYYFKAIGAAIASVAAETVILVVQFVFVRKEISVWKILGSIWKYLFAGVVMTVLLWFENGWIPQTFLGTCVMSVSGAFVYFIMLLILRDSLLLSNIKNMFAKVFKRKGEENEEV
jgi:peptidoglycan biosynthesis protein MviN/MurJ (putative lipid II flippase)